MVTDGEPTAHMEGLEAEFSYPPTRRTIEETLKEVQRCTREGITINTFMLERSQYLMAFVEQMTRINRGRAFFSRRGAARRVPPRRLREQQAPEGVVAMSTFDLRTALEAEPFPFKSELSLTPLLDFWTTKVTETRSVRSEIGRMVERELAWVPELTGTIDDVWVFARHYDVVNLLMSVVFPPVFWSQEYAAVMMPFQLRSVYQSPSFERVLMSEDGLLKGRTVYDGRAMATIRTTLAYTLILRQVYGIEAGNDPYLIVTGTDPDTGLDRHFKVRFDYRFIEVVPQGPAPVLDEETRRRLPSLITNLDALKELLPPERFVFRGFTVFKGVDVTDAGGAVLDQARPDRQGVDRLEHPVPEPAGQAAHAVPLARAAASASPPWRAIRCCSSIPRGAWSTTASSRTPCTTRRRPSRARCTWRR